MCSSSTKIKTLLLSCCLFLSLLNKGAFSDFEEQDLNQRTDSLNRLFFQFWIVVALFSMNEVKGMKKV